ncbi:SIMPL domain-containing protein [Haloarculaceae archaeon H-GB2-1]|nr:SIMPL domain-containing protein [Haloarculaceae archaeon H-GB1-1]MEA5406788.1 SIMPL domain-containing protein [Haloarculaceae archaeon H-GB2-1]
MEFTNRLLSLTGTVVLVLAALSTGPAVAGAQEAGNDAEAGNAATVTVTASGQASADPDEAVLVVVSRATADSPDEATQRLAANTTRLRSALLNTSVTEDRLRTVSFNLFERRPDRNDSTVFVAEQRFEVRLNDTGAVGSTIDTAVSNGAAGVESVRFSLSEDTRRDLRRQALTDAMGNARQQAVTLATAENLSLVGVRSISTGEPEFGTLQLQAQRAETVVEPSPVTVTATVTVQYNATS